MNLRSGRPLRSLDEAPRTRMQRLVSFLPVPKGWRQADRAAEVLRLAFPGLPVEAGREDVFRGATGTYTYTDREVLDFLDDYCAMLRLPVKF